MLRPVSIETTRRDRSVRRRLAASLGLALVVGAILLGSVFSSAEAGRLHPAVQDQFADLAPTDEATVLLILTDQADISALNGALKMQRATRQERHRQVIEELQKAAARSQGPLIDELNRRRGLGQISGFTPYWITNLIVVRGQRGAIEELAARLDIDVVEPEVRPELIEPIGGLPALGATEKNERAGLTPGVRAVRANEVWHNLGIDGPGALVAVIDTGVDGNHQALRYNWRGYQGAHPWQECWLDVLGTNTQFPNDGYGHGTHVMGTIAGMTAADSIGVAYGAQWIACNAINQGVGSGFDQDVIDCFQWLADPDGNPNTVDDVPDVVQNSWRINEGFGGGYTDCDTRWWAAIDNCEASGVVVTFSAGNEGPGAQTIGSPSDRATTAYNVFSVGAVDATNYQFPYPIAGFSSRGPTGCNVPVELKIKPEISAPGVAVYSAWPGGGYTNLDGTSMAGPHVAGVVGLMRAANPDVDVDTIKQILFDTARDEGPAGEDNTYGWGMIDAYESVIRVLTGYGTLAGEVTNASNGGTPIDGATVRLVEINRNFVSDAVGHYSGMAAEGTYTAEVTHPSFATVNLPGVSLLAGETTTQDFALNDTGSPTFVDLDSPEAVQDPNAPIPVSVLIEDYSAIAAATLTWRVNGGSFSDVPMALQPSGRHLALIPGQAVGSNIEFYLTAEDIEGNDGIDPPGAPIDLHQILVTFAFFVEDGETEQGWTLSAPGDAVNGRWVRMDPYGTQSGGIQVEPADDHTAAPGTQCFVTGAGTPGGPASGSDVDGGCVTLLSPVIDLATAEEAIVRYWRWFINTGGMGGYMLAYVSNNNGNSWVILEQLPGGLANQWTQRSYNLADLLPLTDRMRFRFLVCDNGEESLVEAAIDDFIIEGIPGVTAIEGTLAEGGSTRLMPNRPNPFSRETSIRFHLAESGPADLVVYDPAGRRVRALVSGPQGAGEHAVTWDGRDDQGHVVSAGVYFYELRASGVETQRKMLLLR